MTWLLIVFVFTGEVRTPTIVGEYRSLTVCEEEASKFARLDTIGSYIRTVCIKGN